MEPLVFQSTGEFDPDEQVDPTPEKSPREEAAARVGDPPILDHDVVLRVVPGLSIGLLEGINS